MKRLLGLLLVATLVSAAQAIPAYINYQGTLLNNSGVPVTQTNAPVVISIWDHATSTVAGNKKYQESHTVNVNDGVFSFAIGSGSAPVGTFNAALFDTAGDRYLQLNVNGEDMLPRVRFLSAPFTLQSQNTQTLGNFPPAHFASAAALAALQNQVNNLQIPSLESLCNLTLGAVWVKSQNFCLGGSVDASSRDFTGEVLAGVHLQKASLNKSDLKNADLSGSCLMNVGLDTQTQFDGTNLQGSVITGSNFTELSLNTSNLVGLYSDNLDTCPQSLPANWACVEQRTKPDVAYRLVGPGARFNGGSCGVSAAIWEGTVFPVHLEDVNFSGNILETCTFPNGVKFTNTNFLGASVHNCTLNGEPVWGNTTCPDGSNSDDDLNNGTCYGHGITFIQK